jgi:hypothetical protein
MKHLLIAFCFLSFAANAQRQYVFYLHGAIVEGSDGAPVSQQYGKYDYYAIIKALKDNGYTVISEIRPATTYPPDYAQKTIQEIKELKQKEISSSYITVIGASKGAMITMLVSRMLKDTAMKFVIMGACNEGSENKLYGRVLSIYERSDNIGRSCSAIKKGSSDGLTAYKEVEINTGLKHGFIYNPIKEWIEPACAWIGK